MRTLLNWFRGVATLVVLLWLVGGVSGTQPSAGFETSVTLGESQQALNQPSKARPGANKATVQVSYSRLPLHFEANHGQTNDQVKFLARGRGYTVCLTPTEAVLVSSPPPTIPPPRAT